MKKKNLLIVFFFTIITISLFSGCAPKLEDISKPVHLSNNKLTDYSRNELLKANGMTGSIRFLPDSSYRLESRYFIKDNKVYAENISACGDDCVWRTHHKEVVVDFFKYVERYKHFIAKKISKYFDGYSENQDIIKKWQNEISTKTPKFIIESQPKLNKKTRDLISNKVKYKKLVNSTESIYQKFHKAKEKNNKIDLIDYMNKNVCLFTVDEREKSVSEKGLIFQRKYNSENLSCITNEKIHNTVVNGNIYFNFTPYSYLTSNKNLKIKLINSGYNSYQAEITNKTSSFIDFKTLSIYYGGLILTTNVKNLKVPPYGIIKTKRNNELYLPEISLQKRLNSQNRRYIKLDNINDKYEFGIAGEYTINGKLKNIYNTKEFKFRVNK